MMRALIASLVLVCEASPLGHAENQNELSDLFACLEEFTNSDRLSCYDDAVEQLYADRVPQSTAPESVATDATSTTDETLEEAPSPVAERSRDEPRRFLRRVTKFGYTSDDKIMVWLDNGNVWRQSDSVYLRSQTSDGVAEAELRRGAFGSTWIKLDGGTAFKAKRVD